MSCFCKYRAKLNFVTYSFNSLIKISYVPFSTNRHLWQKTTFPQTTVERVMEKNYERHLTKRKSRYAKWHDKESPNFLRSKRYGSNDAVASAKKLLGGKATPVENIRSAFMSRIEEYLQEQTCDDLREVMISKVHLSSRKSEVLVVHWVATGDRERDARMQSRLKQIQFGVRGFASNTNQRPVVEWIPDTTAVNERMVFDLLATADFGEWEGETPPVPSSQSSAQTENFESQPSMESSTYHPDAADLPEDPQSSAVDYRMSLATEPVATECVTEYGASTNLNAEVNTDFDKNVLNTNEGNSLDVSHTPQPEDIQNLKHKSKVDRNEGLQNLQFRSDLYGLDYNAVFQKIIQEKNKRSKDREEAQKISGSKLSTKKAAKPRKKSLKKKTKFPEKCHLTRHDFDINSDSDSDSD